MTVGIQTVAVNSGIVRSRKPAFPSWVEEIKVPRSGGSVVALRGWHESREAEGGGVPVVVTCGLNGLCEAASKEREEPQAHVAVGLFLLQSPGVRLWFLDGNMKASTRTAKVFRDSLHEAGGRVMRNSIAPPPRQVDIWVWDGFASDRCALLQQGRIVALKALPNAHLIKPRQKTHCSNFAAKAAAPGAMSPHN